MSKMLPLARPVFSALLLGLLAHQALSVNWDHYCVSRCLNGRGGVLCRCNAMHFNGKRSGASLPSASPSLLSSSSSSSTSSSSKHPKYISTDRGTNGPHLVTNAADQYATYVTNPAHFSGDGPSLGKTRAFVVGDENTLRLLSLAKQDMEARRKQESFNNFDDTDLIDSTAAAIGVPTMEDTDSLPPSLDGDFFNLDQNAFSRSGIVHSEQHDANPNGDFVDSEGKNVSTDNKKKQQQQKQQQHQQLLELEQILKQILYKR